MWRAKGKTAGIKITISARRYRAEQQKIKRRSGKIPQSFSNNRETKNRTCQEQKCDNIGNDEGLKKEKERG